MGSVIQQKEQNQCVLLVVVMINADDAVIWMSQDQQRRFPQLQVTVYNSYSYVLLTQWVNESPDTTNM